ncbi:MAG TPA: rhodanese-like domain-containing protein [Fibrobacteria bacterium]|nr:rhodanese-like domain-containing protein [Fibrobacteria bacterium]
MASRPRVPLLCCAAALLLAALSPAQTPSLTEKLEGRLRIAIIKATKDLDVPLIKAAELKAILEDTNLVLIDVRQPREQEVSMLPHALTTAGFAEKFRHGIPAGKRLVVYCTIGYRSGKYALELAKQGIKAENLEGGVLAWSFAGGKFLVKDAQGGWSGTHRIHVYAPEWNIVHPDYVGVVQ